MKLIFAFLFCATAWGQLGQRIIFVRADPSGACVARVPYRYNESNGKLFGCLDNDGDGTGAWTEISGAASIVGGNGLLTFGLIHDGGCSDLTFPLTGVATDQQLAPGWPSALPAGLSGIVIASAADTVKVRVCNLSGSDVTLGALNYQAAIAAGGISASSALDFPSIIDGTCSALTFTFSGALSGDHIVAGWPATLPVGLHGSMLVSTTDTVRVELCNWSGAAIDPASLTFSARIP